MTRLVRVLATIKPGCLDEAVAFLKQRFPETRAYAGCQGIEAYVADDGATLTMIEHWDSQGDFDSYLKWRQDTGSFDTFTGFVDGDMEFQFFNKVDT